MKKTYSGAALRHIAMCTMLLDHIAVCLIEHSSFIHTGAGEWIYAILRLVGRMAFPLYCFLLVEAFRYTKCRTKYVLSLIAMGLISEPIFDYAIYGAWNMEHQNVLITLSIGFLMIWSLERSRESAEHIMHYPARIGLLISSHGVFIAAAGFLTWYLRSDYGIAGILYLAVLYLLRDKRDGKAVAGLLVLGAESGLGALCSIYLIYQYNGEYGNLKVPHWFYRLFYPLHLLVLLMIRNWIL